MAQWIPPEVSSKILADAIANGTAKPSVASEFNARQAYGNSNNNNVSYGGLVTDKEGHTTRSYTENNRYGQQNGTVLPGSVFDPNSQNYDSDYAHGLAENVNGQKVFYDANGNLPSSTQALKDSLANNRVYSTTSDKNSGGGTSSYSPSTSYSSSYSPNYNYGYSNYNNNDTQNLINQIYQARQDSLPAQYQAQKDTASNQSIMNRNAIDERLAAQGNIRSGDAVTSQVANNTALGQNLNSINTQQNTATNDLLAQKLSALLTQSNADRSYGLQEQAQQNQVNQFNQNLAMQQQAAAQAQSNYMNDFNFKQKQADIQNALAQGQLTAQQAQQALDNAYRQAQVNESNARWAEEYHNSKDQADLARQFQQQQFQAQQAQQAYQNQLAQQRASGSSYNNAPSTTTASTNKDLSAINDIVNGSYNLSEKARVLQSYIQSLNGSSGAQAEYLKSYAIQALQVVNQQLSEYNSSGRYAGM